MTNLRESVVIDGNEEDLSETLSVYDGEQADEDWHFENALIEERKRLNQQFVSKSGNQT